MAGTRLFIQTVFTIELVLLLGIAFYGGILINKDDPLSIALRHQDGRGLLGRLRQSSPVLNGQGEMDLQSLPKIHILVQASQSVFWKGIVTKTKLPRDVLMVHGDETGTVSKVCGNPDLLRQQTSINADIFVCDTWTTHEKPRLVTVGGVAILYPRSISQRSNDFAAIYPNASAVNCLSGSSTSRPIHLLLAMDEQRDNADWKEWISSLQSAFEKFQATWNSLMRGDGPHIDFSVRVVDGKYNLQDLVDPASLNDIFGTNLVDRIEIVWYVPSPSQVETSDEWYNHVHITQGSRLVHVLSTADNFSSKTGMIDELLAATSNWIFRQCLGIPISNLVDEEFRDTDFPRWYMKLWWQRSLSVMYTKAVQMARRQAQIWSDLSFRSPLTRDVVQRFNEEALQKIERVPGLLSEDPALQALEELESSLVVLSELEEDEAYIPPLDYPPEQYAAIFAPLVVPLLLPLLVGLVREYRRFRNLVANKSRHY